MITVVETSSGDYGLVYGDTVIVLTQEGDVKYEPLSDKKHTRVVTVNPTDDTQLTDLEKAIVRTNSLQDAVNLYGKNPRTPEEPKELGSTYVDRHGYPWVRAAKNEEPWFNSDLGWAHWGRFAR